MHFKATIPEFWIYLKVIINDGSDGLEVNHLRLEIVTMHIAKNIHLKETSPQRCRRKRGIKDQKILKVLRYFIASQALARWDY